jgi:adenine-specific DNA-methyltransferase
MTKTQPTQPELFDVAELPGRPMLHWHGKRPLREIPYYPAQLRERYGSTKLTTGGPPPPPSPRPLPRAGEGGGAERSEAGESEGQWTSRLYWGDNLQVMAHLMRQFRGQIKLIYIDPPFDSGADYRKRVRLRGTSVETDLSVLEERQYTDIWSNDLYLQYMYERLILMRELLAEDGSIYLHCDWHRGHYLRCILDEVFGYDNFINEIIWRRTASHNDPGRYGIIHDTIFFYGKSQAYTWNSPTMEQSQDYIDKFFVWAESPTGEIIRLRTGQKAPAGWRRFRLGNLASPHPRPNLMYEYKGYKPPEKGWKVSIERMEEMDRQGRLYFPESKDHRIQSKSYLDEVIEGKPVPDIWLEMVALQAQSAERENYPTQKPEALLERIIGASSNPGDLVADFFIGSGTTAAVAQQLGRRWIGADINLGAIHTTAQRLARIIEEQQSQPQQLELISDSEEKPGFYPVFEVYNVNHYEVFKNAEEARDIVLQLYGVEPLKGHRFFDGTLDGRWVKVVDLNRICSKLDIQTIFDNLPPDDTQGVVVLCAGHEYDVPEAIKRRNLLGIPFEVRDILTDRKDVIFKRPPEAQVRLTRADGLLTLTIEQFYSPLLLQKLSLEEAASTALRPFGFAQGRQSSGQDSAQAPAIEDWRQTVASVLVDPAYDGQVFHARITDTPARRDELVRGEYTWEAEEYGDGLVAVKIVDVLDEEWFGITNGANQEVSHESL